MRWVVLVSHREFTFTISQTVYYNYTWVEFFFYIYAHIFVTLVITCGSIPHLHVTSDACHKQKAVSVADNLYSLRSWSTALSSQVVNRLLPMIINISFVKVLTRIRFLMGARLHLRQQGELCATTAHIHHVQLCRCICRWPCFAFFLFFLCWFCFNSYVSNQSRKKVHSTGRIWRHNKPTMSGSYWSPAHLRRGVMEVSSNSLKVK